MTTTPPCPEPSYGCRLYTFQHHAESTICFTHHPARLLPVSLAFHLQCRRCRSIPGSGRSPGEGIGYPLQYSLASLVAQLVKNLPAMWETWVHSLGWEDLLEKGKATHSSILENSMDCIVHGIAKELDTTERISLSLSISRSFYGSENTLLIKRYCLMSFSVVFYIMIFSQK